MPAKKRLPISNVITTTAVAATGPLYYFQQLRLLFNPVNESKILIGWKLDYFVGMEDWFAAEVVDMVDYWSVGYV